MSFKGWLKYVKRNLMAPADIAWFSILLSFLTLAVSFIFYLLGVDLKTCALAFIISIPVELILTLMVDIGFSTKDYLRG